MHEVTIFAQKECHFLASGIITYSPRLAYTGRKGVIKLSAIGYVTVHTFTSISQIPLQDATVAITDPNGEPIALRLTDRNGQISPVSISVPDRSASQQPDSGIVPYTLVNIYARKENYEQIEVENVQVFADTVTDQNLQMIPLSELPESWNKAEIFRTTPQNL